MTDENNTIVDAIAGGGALPPEPTPDHEHEGQPSDRTVYVVAALYILGGSFMIWLGVSAVRAMQKRKKETK